MLMNTSSPKIISKQTQRKHQFFFFLCPRTRQQYKRSEELTHLPGIHQTSPSRGSLKISEPCSSDTKWRWSLDLRIWAWMFVQPWFLLCSGSPHLHEWARTPSLCRTVTMTPCNLIKHPCFLWLVSDNLCKQEANAVILNNYLMINWWEIAILKRLSIGKILKINVKSSRFFFLLKFVRIHCGRNMDKSKDLKLPKQINKLKNSTVPLLKRKVTWQMTLYLIGTHFQWSKTERVTYKGKTKTRIFFSCWTWKN